jgi:hypothetical protein
MQNNTAILRGLSSNFLQLMALQTEPFGFIYPQFLNSVHPVKAGGFRERRSAFAGDKATTALNYGRMV